MQYMVIIKEMYIQFQFINNNDVLFPFFQFPIFSNKISADSIVKPLTWEEQITTGEPPLSLERQSTRPHPIHTGYMPKPHLEKAQVTGVCYTYKHKTLLMCQESLAMIKFYVKYCHWFETQLNFCHKNMVKHCWISLQKSSIESNQLAKLIEAITWAIQGVVQPILRAFFASHLQGHFHSFMITPCLWRDGTWSTQ